jgi:ABC-2 type transport system permease protein
MSSLTLARPTTLLEELRKIPAFLRRDFLIMVSYRVALLGDWFNLIAQVVVFYFVSKLIPTETMPVFSGVQPNYMEFVVTGIVPTAFLQIGITRVIAVLRQEQHMGTLEPLLAAPLTPATLQLGSVAYDLVYVPIRSIMFLLMSAIFFDVSFNTGGLGPTVGVLLVFIPFVWGLGMLGSASVLTLKRGAGVVGFASTFLILGSGTYFPLSVFPGWVQDLAVFNPVALALQATRETLIGTDGWGETLPQILRLLPSSILTLVLGLSAFAFALKRERRRGTLGMY